MVLSYRCLILLLVGGLGSRLLRQLNRTVNRELIRRYCNAWPGTRDKRVYLE